MARGPAALSACVAERARARSGPPYLARGRPIDLPARRSGSAQARRVSRLHDIWNAWRRESRDNCCSIARLDDRPSSLPPFLFRLLLGRLTDLDLAAVTAYLDSRRLCADNLGLEQDGREFDALDDPLGSRGGLRLAGGNRSPGSRLGRRLAEQGQELYGSEGGRGKSARSSEEGEQQSGEND